MYIPQAWELECLALDPKLQAIHSGWEGLGKEGGGVWGDDVAWGRKRQRSSGIRVYWTSFGI